jgi:outer membrane protein
MKNATCFGRLVAAALVISLSLPGLALAQATTGLKIGVVDFGDLLQSSPQTESAQRKLNDEFQPRQRELAAKQSELKDREAKLQKDGAVMGAEERRNAEEKLRNDMRDFERKATAFQEDLNARKNETVGKVQADLAKQVQAYAKDHGYDLVLVSGVIFAGPSVDITRQVIDSVKTAGPTAKPATPEPAKAPAKAPAKK